MAVFVGLLCFATGVLSSVEAGVRVGPVHHAHSQPAPGFLAPQAAGRNVELVGQIGGATSAVAVEGRYAYVGVGPRLVILDMADPARPTAVGQSAVLPGVIRGVAVAGSYAYVADW